jgi:hypothetical protein
MTEAHGPPRGSALNAFPSRVARSTDRLQPFLADELEVIEEALLSLDAVFGAPDGPPQDHAQHRIGVFRGERDRARAAHAAAQDVRLLVAEVLEAGRVPARRSAPT